MRDRSELREAPSGARADAVLRPDLAYFPLERELVVFSQASQSLVGLNATAAFLVHKLREGASIGGLAGTLTAEWGVPENEAASWVSATMDALDSQGLLAGSAVPPKPGPSAIEEALTQMRAQVPPRVEPFEPKFEGRYRLLGTTALVRCSHQAQMRMIDAVIGHLKSDEAAAPNLTIDVQGTVWGDRQIRSNVYCDGNPEAQSERLSSLAPLVKSALWSTAVNNHDYLMNLHAGVVGYEGRGILLPAAAGSGKSSLTAALAHSGMGYYSDEVALIEPDTFLVPPVPLAVCVKSTGWDVMSRYFPELSSLRTHIRDDGKIVRYVAPPSAAVQTTPTAVSHIFFPRYAKDEATAITPLTRSEALTRLLGQCLAVPGRLDQDKVSQIVRWISSIRCYALNFSSLDEAVEAVRNALEQK